MTFLTSIRAHFTQTQMFDVLILTFPAKVENMSSSNGVIVSEMIPWDRST